MSTNQPQVITNKSTNQLHASLNLSTNQQPVSVNQQTMSSRLLSINLLQVDQSVNQLIHKFINQLRVSLSQSANLLLVTAFHISGVFLAECVIGYSYSSVYNELDQF